MNYRERNFQTEFKAAQVEATVGEASLIEDIALEIAELRIGVGVKKIGLIEALWKNMSFFESDIFTELSTLAWVGKKRYINEVASIKIAEEVERLRERQEVIAMRADRNKRVGIAYAAYGVPTESLKILANTDRSGPREILDPNN